MFDEDVKQAIARIDERTHIILERLDKINGRLEEHEKRITDIEKIQAKHSSYFKIFGGVLTTLGAILISVANKLFGGR